MSKSQEENEYSQEDYDAEKSEDERECEMCRDIPEQVIHLSCEHIICLECSAKLIFQNKNMEEIDLTEIKCGICQENTMLSEEVQETIVDFLNKGVEEGHFEIEENEEYEENEELEENEKGSQNEYSSNQNEIFRNNDENNGRNSRQNKNQLDDDSQSE